jgi:hypothetical protein
VTLGRQSESFGGAVVWVLPNPSGLNAHYQLPDLAARFRALRLLAQNPMMLGPGLREASCMLAKYGRRLT